MSDDLSIGTRVALWFVQVVIMAGGIVVSTGLMAYLMTTKSWSELTITEQMALSVIFVIIIMIFTALLISVIKRQFKSEIRRGIRGIRGRTYEQERRV